jgi:hypothetical protein
LASENPRASEGTGVPKDTTSRLPIVADRSRWMPLQVISVFESACMLRVCRSLCVLRGGAVWTHVGAGPFVGAHKKLLSYSMIYKF